MQIGNFNLYPNPEIEENRDCVNTKSNDQNKTLPNTTMENVLRATKLKTVSKFAQLGLTAEQIAEALDLPLNKVQEKMK
ncbi:MAG: hypothetical protein WBA93_08615 [Microcoleaceae cyanobacterium]